jgi:hypothetical protein
MEGDADAEDWDVDNGSDDGVRRPADPPEGGWPWQCDLCDVFAVMKKNGNKTYKVQCKLCDWGPDAFTTLDRVKKHFGESLQCAPRSLTSTVCRLSSGGDPPKDLY